MRFSFGLAASFCVAANLSVAAGLNNVDNVQLVFGSSDYGAVERDNGIKPPTESALLESAKNSALAQLKNQQDYVQITSWNLFSNCEALYRGSPLCIRGYARAKAAFVLRADQEKDWYLTTEGIVSSFIREPGNSEQEARERARADAEFACNGRKISELNNAQVWCNEREHPEGGWCKLHYRSTFKCAK